MMAILRMAEVNEVLECGYYHFTMGDRDVHGATGIRPRLFGLRFNS